MRRAIVFAIAAAVVYTHGVSADKHEDCPDGWTRYSNKFSVESASSCFRTITYDPTGPYATPNDACSTDQIHAHLATLAGGDNYRKHGHKNALSLILDTLPVGVEAAAMGCRQRSDAIEGPGMTAQGWEWLDGKKADNLNCKKLDDDGCDIWGVWIDGHNRWPEPS